MRLTVCILSKKMGLIAKSKLSVRHSSHKIFTGFKWVSTKGSNPNSIIIINKYSVVPFTLTYFSEVKLMFSEQKRVKLILSKLTGTFRAQWIFP